MYFVVEIVKTTGCSAKAVTERATQDEALMPLHQALASAMANDKARSCLCLVVTPDGPILRNESRAR